MRPPYGRIGGDRTADVRAVLGLPGGRIVDPASDMGPLGGHQPFTWTAASWSGHTVDLPCRDATRRPDEPDWVHTNDLRCSSKGKSGTPGDSRERGRHDHRVVRLL